MEPYTDTPASHTSPAIPVAIIIGFALIAAAIYFTGNNPPNATTSTATAPTSEQSDSVRQDRIRSVDATDYIRGDPNATILLVEYSDYECVFCKQYHDTMRMIMEDYGATSRVAWVYRQFPIAQMHPNAPRISEAALCVGELGGNQAFWTFTDLVFDKRDLSQTTNMSRLPQFAETAGISLSAYNECLNSGRHRAAVQASVDEALAIGADGTPYTVLIVGDQQVTLSGAQPYAAVRNLIENLLQQIDGVPLEETTT